ncbi:protein NO VEIN domain-containing protein [Haliscomenobacter sp.]|uniref:protein NO VEIN domain-containing protein n=1 Tax=Haliscomenobacter sp. TaxID=2717303 RepID=UPI0035936D19
MSDTILEILIDNSGSMGYMTGYPQHEGKFLIDGLTRMALIKQILAEQIIPTIDYANQITIRTFRFNSKKEEGKVVDELSIPIIFQGAFDKQKILTVIASLQDPASGGTPITAAINKAVTNLSKYPNSDRKIIMLTDGEETGEGDYREAAKKAEQLDGIPCKIFIIGLSQDNQSEEKSREIASGGYYNIKTKSFAANEIQRVLAPLKTAILRNTNQNIQTISNSIHPQIQPAKIKETVEKKIAAVNQQHKQATILQLDELENKIQEQVSNSQKLLEELSSLKELFRVDALLDSGFDATTLTIDSEYSESIRQRSEKFLHEILCHKYGLNKVRWLNENGESGKQHDFEILDDIGNISTLVECKGTSMDKPTFYLTTNEWSHFLKNKEIYQIYRVFNVDGNMNAVCIPNLHLALLKEQVVPYLQKPEILKEGRVFLTLNAIQ